MSVLVVTTLWCCWGYFGCGYLLAWRQGWRGFPAIVAAVLASFVVLFTAALLLQICGWPISRDSWLLASMMLSALAACLPGKRASSATLLLAAAPWWRNKGWHWLWVPVTCAATIISYRLIFQPLTGYDTAFRWDFLARQIVAEGNLGFYPPVTDAAFLHYGWPESIPPLVPLLYAWAYCGAGSTAPQLSAVVGLEVATLVFMLTGKIAARTGGYAAGALACALLATSAVHTWAISMGQETGLLTLGVLALVWAVDRESDDRPDWRLAGLAAGVTALTRDYGLTALVAGAGVLFWMRRPWREMAGYAVVGLVVVLPWFMRTWVLTGNPFYNHDLLGFFPVNPMHAGLMHFYLGYLGWTGHLAERLYELVMQIWPLGLLLLLVGGVGMFQIGPRLIGGRLLAGMWIGLWAWSVGYTMGGFQYSLRVLSPALALLAVAGGAWLARCGGLRRIVWYGGLSLLAVEASLRAVLMLHAPTEFPIRIWPMIGESFSAPRGGADHDRVAKLVGPHRVLVDNAYQHAFLTQRGVHAMPPWTPAVEFLFANNVNVAEAVRQLHQEDVRFLVLSSAPDLKLFLGQYRFFRELKPWVCPVMAGENWMLFSLEEAPILSRP